MGEPARKLENIEPDIRPNFNVLQGGGQSTPERASLKALNNLESNPEKPSTGSIDEQESNGSNVIPGPWANNVSGATSDKSRSGGRFKFAKKKGPLTAIILTLVGGGIGIGGLLSPGLLLVQIKEAMVGKFNTQLASMDVRTTKLLTKKTTAGICGTVITIQCKYSTMSEKQVANFEKAGIKVASEEKTIFGRTKPTSFEFEGKTIKASEFTSTISKDLKFRSAVKLAYNPKFAGFVDSIWNKVSTKFRISKAAEDLSGATDDEKLKKVQEEVKVGSSNLEDIKVGAQKPDGTLYTEEEVKAAKAVVAEVEELTEDGTVSAASKFLKPTATAINAIKISGVADTACMVYNTVKATSIAAKAVRTLQLARYAMLFLGVADQIKAGTAKADDVSYLGKVLTTETKDESGALKSATDSFGYKYAAYNEVGTMPTSATRFMAGGGLAGKMSNVMSLINSSTNNAPESTCKFLSNPFIQIGSFIAGALAWLGAETVVLGAWDIAKLVGMGALTVASYALPSILDDIIAGVLVDKTTVGEDAGDAITSGASGIMGTSAKYGGNSPMTPTEAAAYGNLTQSIVAQYNRDDSMNSNQFDITNDNTFLGKIVTILTPYISKMSSLSGVLNSVMSVTTGSIAVISSPITKASSSAEYSMCQDIDYRKLNIATDPYCNVIYGIPPSALQMDPIDVANYLINIKDPSDPSGMATLPQIDSATGSPIDIYNSYFIPNCINREIPLGTSENDTDDGANCSFGKDILIRSGGTRADGSSYPAVYVNNKYFYVHYIDQRVDSGMDGE
ncbi:MAG: hypothetical protein WCJ36_03330 [Candidatus Saccharibacteria bacterium]